MFNEKKYYNNIKIQEDLLIIKYILFVVVSIVICNYFILKFFNIKPIIAILIGMSIGIILYYFRYIREIGRIEEMKMKIEIYKKISRN